MIARVWKALKDFISGMDYVHREKVASITVWEERELENIFILLLMGSFSGIPAPPAFVAVELLPLLSREIKYFNERAENSFDALAEMTGILDID